MEPFACNGRVDEEQLQQLLACQSEYPSLDYKQSYDLSDAKSKADFVKDAAAMMGRPEGGYLVVGVDGHGSPVNAPLDLPRFDSARLHDLLSKHLEGELIVASQAHKVGTADVVVIYLGRRADLLFPVVKADIQITDSRGGTTTVIRAGDVFVRDGTRTRRWRSGDVEPLIRPYIDAVRREERARIAEFIEHAGPRLRGAETAAGPIAAITWRLPLEQFTATVIEAVRRSDAAAIRLLAMEVSRDGIGLMDEPRTGDSSELLDLLDRAATMLAVGIVLDDSLIRDQTTQALHTIYRRGATDLDLDPKSEDVPTIWLEITTRILAAIALALRTETWAAIPPLVLRQVGRHSYTYASWLEHADVWAHRTGQHSRLVEGKHLSGLVIALARQVVERVPALVMDTKVAPPAPLGEAPARLDPVLDSVCQADFLACVISDAASGGLMTPSFGALYTHRTVPIIEQLLTDSAIAAQLLPGLTPTQVFELATQVVTRADRQSFSAGGHWGFETESLERYRPVT